MKGLTTGSGLASLDPLCGLDVSGASVREYIWLPEAEIAPTMASRAQIDRPITTVDGISGGSPTLYYVHTDHLHRPVKMSDASKAFAWQAEYQPRAPIVRARPIGRTSASVNRQRHQIGRGAIALRPLKP